MKLLKIFKGEKIIRVKATPKRVAHKRRIKTSDKKEDKIEKIINNYEKSIKDKTYEIGGAFDNNGKMVLFKDGDEDHIEFTKSEQKKLKGSIFTHNHPRGYSLSMGDIIYAGESKMKEVRCISKSDGKTYSIKRKDGENFTRRFCFNVLYAKALKYDKIIYKENMKKVESGEVSIYDVNKIHWDCVWKKVTDDVPEIIYGVK